MIQTRIVFITGATGFIGRLLCLRLASAGYQVRASVRDLSLVEPLECVTYYETGDIRRFSEWEKALRDCNCVVHLAARVHVMQEQASEPLTEFRRTNVAVTAALADAALKTGVSKFIFLSSIGVLGDATSCTPFNDNSIPNPHNAYSRSKLEAETMLQSIAADTSLSVTVVRPPLVYGPGNPGNFLSLLKAVNAGYPLPLGGISNKRSLIYVGNLVDALATCAAHPAAAGRTYLVSDGDDVSTPELIRRAAEALGVSARLLSFPLPLMRLAGKVTGKSGAVSRLTGSLVIDSSTITEELGWRPPFSMSQGLKETAQWFKKEMRK